MILWWLACTGPTLVTEALPSARVGTRYAAVIETRGRKPTFSADGLPEGLALHPELGLISGVPRAPGVATVTVRIARDEVVDERTYVLEVGGAERGCDVAWSGTFTEGALRDDGTLDGDAGGGWAADVLPIPGPSIDRVDFEVIGAQLFLVEPGRPFVLGEALSDQAEALRPRTIDGATTLSLGFDTRPHLGAHQAVAEDPTLVVASAEPGAWSVRTTCVPGPVISSLRRGPFRLGDRVITGFGVTRPDPEVAVAALDPLPQGLALTPNGLLTGTAEQAGDHSFRIQVTGGDGRQTVGVARVGIIEPVRLACGETRPLATARASSDLAEVGQIALIEADWADHVALAFTVDAGPTARVRVVPSDLRLVAPLPADLAVVEGPAFVELAPDSLPVAAYYQRWPQARLVLD
ncbi:MAG: Ig domain-containing protein, partial [Myxococcota bacterium]